ncbi:MULTISPECIES: restriction endonuclease subunit S [Burkholderia]|nr:MULTISPECIES: restriction endonuclease subunit S [Burkholderia]
MSEQKSAQRTLVPELRFPEFREAGEWHEKKLAQFLTESRIEGSAGDIAKKITVKLWGKGVFAKRESIKGSENTKYYKRRAGQFIYSKLDFLNQAFGIVPKELDGFESTVDLPCFDIGEELDPVFLLEYVKREGFYKKNGEVADGGRKAKRIQAEMFLSFPIVLPIQKAEQQKIADCLSSLDDLIMAENQKLDAIRNQKKGLMQQLFPREGETIPRLRFPEFRAAEAWKEAALSTWIDLISGLHLAPDEYADAGDVPYFTGPSDYANDLALVSKWTSHSVNSGRSGDILITVKGSGVGELLYLELDEVAMGRQLMAVRPKSVHGEFLFHFLATQRQRLIALASGNLIPGLSRGDILSLTALVPQREEQQAIADCLSSLDDLIAVQNQKIDVLLVHKKGLMQRLFVAQSGVQE